MMKNKRLLIALFCGFFVVLILLFTLRKQEIPLQYRGSWVLSVDKTIFYNRKDPVWKEEYDNLSFTMPAKDVDYFNIFRCYI